MHTLPNLPDTIAKYGLATRKSLGQHFLLNMAITERIAHCAGELSGITVVEIGPGPGGLTRALLATDAKEVLVVEKDARCIAVMQELQGVSAGRLRIIEADALEVNLLEVAPAPRCIVANLPYNAGTAMLIQWLEQVEAQGAGAFEHMTLMFQREVARRITAAPGSKDYGRLSVLAQWLCECDDLFDLPPGAFSPPPKVHSTVVRLTPRKEPLVPVAKSSLEKLLSAAFGQRRKMLRAALKTILPNAEAFLQEAGVDPTLRAEQLDVATFCRLAQKL